MYMPKHIDILLYDSTSLRVKGPRASGPREEEEEEVVVVLEE